MCQVGFEIHLPGGCFKTPSMAWGVVNQELLSIHQLVSVWDGEGSGSNDAKARGPPSGHRV